MVYTPAPATPAPAAATPAPAAATPAPAAATPAPAAATPAHPAVIMPFQPHAAKSILEDGTEFEIRSTSCGCETGTEVFVYTSQTAKKITGIFTCGRVISAPVPEFWEKVGGRCGLTEDEFYDNFAGTKEGEAVFVFEVLRPRLITPFAPQKDNGERITGIQSTRYVETGRNIDLTPFLAALED